MLSSKYNQIFFYVIIGIFSILFIFYFYTQASVSGYVVEDIKVDKIIKNKKINKTMEINTGLFEENKFKKLRNVGIPTPKFNIGKRNPFEQS